MIRTALIFALFALLCAPTARAQAIDAAGAERLKTVFSNLIQERQGLTLANGGKFQYIGGVDVEAAGSYYAITLPHLSIVYPDGKKLTIGMVSMNAIPDKEAGAWKVSLALPTPITLLDKDGGSIREIHFGAQRAAGIWREDIGAFSKLDAQYQNITIDDDALAISVLIPKARVLFNFAKDSNGRWSGPLELALENLQGASDAGKASVTAEKIGLRADLASIDFAALHKISGLADIGKALQTLAARLSAENVNIARMGLDESAQGNIESFYAGLSANFAAKKARFTISNLEQITQALQTTGQEGLLAAINAFLQGATIETDENGKQVQAVEWNFAEAPSAPTPPSAGTAK